MVELHEEIYSAASSFNFTATPLESVEIGDGALALAAARPKPYDIVIVDVFSGGAVPSTLESPQFFEHVKRLVVSHHQPPGVLALNWYGPTASEALRCLLCRLRRVFQGVRVFADVEDAAVKNHVVFASDDSEFAALDVADIVAAEKQRLLEAGKILDAQEAEILNKLDKMEIEVIRPGLKACSELEHGDGRRCAGARAAAGKEAAVAHWRAMRGQFGDAFWHL